VSSQAPLDDEYPFEDALAAASHYALSTGVACRVIDGTGRLMGGETAGPEAAVGEMAGGEEGICGLCSLVYGDARAGLLCRETRRYGAVQAERFGGIYFYFCAASLLHWASPIMYEGRMRAACIAGPVLPYDNEEIAWELRRKLDSGEEFSQRDFSSRIAGIPKVSMDRMHSLGELLKHLCSDLSDATVGLLFDRDEAMELQARLYDYIDEETTSLYPFEAERILQTRVAEGDQSAAGTALQELFAALIVYSGRGHAKIRSRSTELISLISRSAVEGGADGDTIHALNEEYLSSIISARDAEMILLQLSRAVKKYSRLVREMSSVPHLDAINRVKNYCRRHYARKISLDEAAAEVNLSPSYLSKVFRREMGISFVSYLNKIRIEKSKLILQNRSVELVEVAGMVGYDDQSYFTRIFKRFTGIPPGRYREQRGRFPSNSQEIHEDDVYEG